MPKVFVVQEPTKWDEEKHARVPILNIQSAKEHGEIVVMLPPGRIAVDPRETIADLTRYLERYGPNDYLLLSGNPNAIGWACAIAAQQTDGLINTLEYDRRDERYMIRRAQVW